MIDYEHSKITGRKAIETMNLSRTVFATISIIVVFAFGGCDRAIDPESLPPIPSVNTSEFDHTVKKQIADVMSDLQASPHKSEVNGKAAMTLHVYRLLNEADVLYQRAHALRPDDVRWVYYRALVLQKNGELDVATREFERAIELDPNNTMIQVAAADSLIEMGEFDRATHRYEQLIARFKDKPEIWHGYGRLLRSNGQYEQSTRAYTKVIELTGHFSPAYFGISQNFRLLGDLEQAEHYQNLRSQHENTKVGIRDKFGEELRRLDRSVSTRNRIVRQLVNLGKVDDAIKILETVIRDDPDDAGAHISMIGLYTSRNENEKVKFHIAEAERIDGDRPKLHFNLGTYYMKNNQFPEAVKAFTRAVELNPEDADTLVRLGMAHENLGEHNTAKETFLTALSKDSAHREANYLLGRQYSKQKDFAKAIPLLKKATVKIDDRRAVYLNVLARIQAMSGDMVSAFATSEEALDLVNELTDTELAERIKGDHARISAARERGTP